MFPELSLQVAHSMTALAAIVTGVTLLILWRAIPEEKALLWWSVAGFLTALRWIVVAVLEPGGVTYAWLIEDVAVAAGMAVLLGGALVCLRKPIPVVPLVFAVAIVIAWLVFVYEAGLPSLVRLVTVSLLASAALGVTSYAFLRAWQEERNRHYAVISALLGIWSVNWLATPLAGPDSTAALAAAFMRPALHVTTMIVFALAIQDRIARRVRAENADRRRAEEATRANQRRFEDFVETSSDWVWELDKDLRFTFMSPGVLAITGYAAHEYLGKCRDEIYDAAYFDENWADLKRSLERREPFKQVHLRTYNERLGKPVTYAISGKPVFGSGGEFIGYRGTGRDLSAQVETQAALDAVLGGVEGVVGPDYFRTLVRHLARALFFDVAFVAVVDQQGRQMRSLALWVDGGIAENIEYNLPDTPYARIIEKRFAIYLEGVATRFPDDILMQAMRMEGCIGIALAASNSAPVGLIVLLKRTRIENAELAGTVLKALAPRAAAELERQIADQKLRESERRFRDVLDHLPVSVHIKVGDRFQFVNRTFARFVGIPVQEIEGLSSAELHARMGWQGEQRFDALAVQDEVRRTGRVVTRERRVRFADGKSHEIVVATFPITNASGDIVAVGAAATDLTDMRRMETSLAQAQKMDALGRLAGGIAHDFNNIIGAIAGFARFIVEDAPQDTTMQRHAERILAASGRAQKLVQQILTFSRRRDMPRQHLPIAGLLDEVVGLLRATLPRSTRLEIESTYPSAALDADPTQITQLLVNIFVNANDALNDQAGRIGFTSVEVDGADVAARIDQSAEIVELADGALRLVAGKIDRVRKYVLLRVADTGHGMRRAVLEQIFDPFFTTKAQGQGTGLGLPVVHGVVLDHGGALAITTRAGHGTTFEVWFPIAATADEPRHVGDAAAAPLGRGRILIVDDDDDFADMIATALDRLGYEVAVVNRAGEALGAFDDDPALWDLVITDHTMPDMTGLELIGRMRQKRPDIACILCTGYGHPTTAASALSAGASAYLKKPIDLSELGRAVARLIRNPRRPEQDPGAGSCRLPGAKSDRGAPGPI